MTGIDPMTGVPAYRQLADLLRQQIASGELAPRTPIPSAKTLAAGHGLAIGTVTKAVGVLRDEGLVVTVPGRGVWVTARPAPAAARRKA
jgi:DNA-binding GntR family transcriptional regulator